MKSATGLDLILTIPAGSVQSFADHLEPCPVPSVPKLARHVRAKDQDGRHCVVPRRPLPPSAVSDVFRLPLPSPIIPGGPM